MTRLASIAFITATVLGAAACTEAPTTVDQPTAGDPVVARVDDTHGSLQWIADPSGAVGVLEITDLAHTPAEYLRDVEHATPLEIFLALSDGAEVPAALLADHRAQVGDAEPRALAAPVAGVTEFEPFADCQATPWHTFLDVVQAGYQVHFWAFHNPPGDIFYSSRIDNQFSRRFDACAGSNVLGSSKLSLTIGRKTDAAAVFTTVASVYLNTDTRFSFTSVGGTYPDWEMRIVAPDVGYVRSYGVGRAYNGNFAP